jgi:hypothetical protein
MKKLFIPIAMLLTIILSGFSEAQDWMPVLLDERGDTIHYEYRPR